MGDATKSSAYLGYSRRASNELGTAGLDPHRTFEMELKAM
jgi:hypothetical protein